MLRLWNVWGEIEGGWVLPAAWFYNPFHVCAFACLSIFHSGDQEGLANHQQHQHHERRSQRVLVRPHSRVAVLVQGWWGEMAFIQSRTYSTHKNVDFCIACLCVYYTRFLTFCFNLMWFICQRHISQIFSVSFKLTCGICLFAL